MDDVAHSKAILTLLNAYACDIMGGGESLSEYVQENLIDELSKRSDVLIVLAYDDGKPIGLAISFEGFSTFYAQPLLNIHDFVVIPEYRRKGVAKLILEKIESISKQRNYCKLTLEVLEGNVRAQKVYKDFGFASYVLDDQMGRGLFFDKKLHH